MIFILLNTHNDQFSVDNKIKQMNGDSFRRLSDLKVVYLSGNECVDENFEGEVLETAARVVTDKCGFYENALDNATNPFDFDCGKTFFNYGLVVGGTEIIRGQWPFIAALRLLETKKYFCGGSLISTHHVLSGE